MSAHVQNELADARERLDDLLAGPLSSPAVGADIDQLTAALRRRFSECGVDLHDPNTRAALVVLVDTIISSLGPLASHDETTARMWAIAAQITAAVMTIDHHERRAHP